LSSASEELNRANLGKAIGHDGENLSEQNGRAEGAKMRERFGGLLV
jgi:hypothetical protein